MRPGPALAGPGGVDRLGAVGRGRHGRRPGEAPRRPRAEADRPAIGAAFAVDELVYGSKGEPEVVVAGGTEQAAPTAAGAAKRFGTSALSPTGVAASPPATAAIPPGRSIRPRGVPAGSRRPRRHPRITEPTMTRDRLRSASSPPVGPDRRRSAATGRPTCGPMPSLRTSRASAPPASRSSPRPPRTWTRNSAGPPTDSPTRSVRTSATRPASTTLASPLARPGVARPSVPGRRGPVPGDARRPVRRLPGGRGDVRLGATGSRPRPAGPTPRCDGSSIRRRTRPRSERAAAEAELRKLGPSIFGVLIADLAISRVLRDLRLPVAAVAGHSAGELAALLAAGAMRIGRHARLAADRDGRPDAATGGRGRRPDVALLAVGAGRATVGEVAAAVAGGAVEVAMDNCPHQCVAVGPTHLVAAVEAALHRAGPALRAAAVPPAVPHPAVRAVDGAVPRAVRRDPVRRPRTPASTRARPAAPFPADPAAIRDAGGQPLGVARSSSPG